MITPQLAEHFRINHIEVIDFTILSQSLLVLSYLLVFAEAIKILKLGLEEFFFANGVVIGQV